VLPLVEIDVVLQVRWCWHVTVTETFAQKSTSTPSTISKVYLCFPFLDVTYDPYAGFELKNVATYTGLFQTM
jgi:hypothetical protein